MFSAPGKVRLCALVFCLYSLFFSISALAQNALSEEQAKASLLYNFIKHVSWPEETHIPSLKVAFWGVDGLFHAAFDNIASEARIRNKSLQSSNIDSYHSASSYHVLVVGQQFEHLLPRVAAELAKSNTLIVSDGAKERSAIMINFTYPSEQQLSFEVNSANVAVEGLRLSNDILLFGGTEVDVVALYRDLEKDLLASKQAFREQQRLLLEQENALLVQSQKLGQQDELIRQQGEHIVKQQSNIQTLTDKQLDIESSLSRSSKALMLSLQENEAVKADLDNSRGESQRLASEIIKNQLILDEQQSKMADLSLQIDSQVEQLDSQQDTIANQRGIIVIVLSILLIIALYMIARQKHALRQERALLEAKAELVKAQEKSIDAYKVSLESKDNFLSAINHELRTPMHLIMGALHNISEKDKTGLQQGLDIVEQGAEQMLELISDILLYSELQAGDVSVNPCDVDIKYQMVDVCDKYEQMALDRDLGFYLHFARTVPQYLSFDIDRFCVVIEKILDNALRFTQEGDIVVNIDWHVAKGSQLIVQINDTGIGMSQAQLEKVFQPFDQYQGGLSREYEGLGIGLSLCQKIMQALGGEITISSDPACGTSVYLSLPAANVMDIEKPAQAFLQLAVDNTKTVQTVLVVEDNIVSQLLTERIVQDLGYEAMVAGSGQQALELMRECHPHLVLMDLQMPAMDGISCYQQMLEEPSLANIPVIALTANAQQSIKTQCLSLGMCAVLTKPVHIEKLKYNIEIHALSDESDQVNA